VSWNSDALIAGGRSAIDLLTVRGSVCSRSGARPENEDSVGVAAVGESWICVLSDGAGGHGGGATASKIAVERIIEGFRARPAREGDDLKELILDAHDAVVVAQSKLGGEASQMHATVVVLTVDSAARAAIWGHVGDSRLYFLRGGRVVTTTRDDSVVQRLVESGLLAESDARDHPNKNRLLAALGMTDELEPQATAAAQPLQDGDALLLCSDGWWDGLSNADIEAAFAVARTHEEWLDKMAERIAAQERPHQDNYSAIAVWIGDPGERTIMPQVG